MNGVIKPARPLIVEKFKKICDESYKFVKNIKYTNFYTYENTKMIANTIKNISANAAKRKMLFV